MDDALFRFRRMVEVAQVETVPCVSGDGKHTCQARTPMEADAFFKEHGEGPKPKSALGGMPWFSLDGRAAAQALHEHHPELKPVRMPEARSIDEAQELFRTARTIAVKCIDGDRELEVQTYPEAVEFFNPEKPADDGNEERITGAEASTSVLPDTDIGD